MNNLNRVTDPEPVRGEFDPANTTQMDRLMRAATIHYGAQLALLPASLREEVLEDARFGAIEVALSYDPSTAKTTKWKTAANRANTIVRKFFRELPRQPQNETDVLERVRRKSRRGDDVDPDGDAGELDISVLAADDDDDYDDSDEYDGLSDDDYDAFMREEEDLFASAPSGQGEGEVEPTDEELNPLVRAPDEDAEHFEMRRHLIASAQEPDRTVLRCWTLAATDVGQMVGISGDAVRQRKTRLRRLIDTELGRPGPLRSAISDPSRSDP